MIHRTIQASNTIESGMRREKNSIRGGFNFRPGHRFAQNKEMESDIAETIDNCKVIH